MAHPQESTHGFTCTVLFFEMVSEITAPTPSELAKADEVVNRLEKQIAQLPPVEMPVVHRFTHGPDGKVNLYTRQIFMPAGTILTSKIHKTEHQYIVSQGSAAVRDNDGAWTMINAPYHGITQPGTRRALFIVADCIWTTMHVVDTDNLEEIEKKLIEPFNSLEETP